jgi:threonine synthase
MIGYEFAQNHQVSSGCFKPRYRFSLNASIWGMEYRLVCTKCGKEEGDSAFRCSRCGSILEVVYPDSKIKPYRFRKSNKLSDFIDFLPLKEVSISLNEGGTPVKKADLDGVDTEIYLKLETDNPTKTFKDRGSAVEVSKALEIGTRGICCASTGNMGLSVARYSKHAGIDCTIFISGNANEKKIAKIEKEGAELIKVRGDFNNALRSAELFAKKEGVFVCGDYHFRKEGQKTVAYEIIKQLVRKMPDFVFVPVGNATLLSAMYKGFKEFKKMGLVKELPKLIAVQSEKCDPLVNAYAHHRAIRYVVPKTEADAIAVGYPTFGFEALNALRATKGQAIAVSENEIADAVRLLESYKVYAELGGGTAFAGLRRFANASGGRLSGKRAVVIITGNNEGRFR